MQKPEGLILDFDGIFYRYTQAFHDACDAACVRTAIGMGIEGDRESLRGEFRRDKNGLRTFKRLMPEGDVMTFHRRYHAAVDFEGTFEREQEAVAVFTGLARRKLPMVILTQSSYEWVARVNAYLGISGFLPESHVLGFQESGGVFKHESPTPVEAAARVLGISPGRLGMLEDSHINLTHAHNIGVQTAYVHYGQSLDPKPQHVCHQGPSVASVVRQMGL